MNSNKRDICPECGGDNRTHFLNCSIWDPPAPVAELPKEAEQVAKELVEKFMYELMFITNIADRLPIAKQCALICVDEILDCKHGWNKETSSFVAHWQQVRTAINQL